MSCQIHAPAALSPPPGRAPPVPTEQEKRGWGAPGQFGRFREVTNVLSLPAIEPRFLSFPAHGLLVYRLQIKLENKQSSQWL